MRLIELPHCDRVAWDGDTLYAATRDGHCHRVLPDCEPIAFGANRTEWWENTRLEALNGSVHVERRFVDTSNPPAMAEDNWMSHPREYATGTTNPQHFVLQPPFPILLTRDDALAGCRNALMAAADSLLAVSGSRISVLDCTSRKLHQLRVFIEELGARRPHHRDDRPIRALLRSTEGEVLAMLDGGTLALVELEEEAALLRMTAVRRSGQRVASCLGITAERALFRTRQGTSLLVERDSNRELAESDSPGGPLSADGRWIGEPGSDRFRLLDGQTLKLRQEFAVPAADVAFAPNGFTVAAASSDGVRVIDLD